LGKGEGAILYEAGGKQYIDGLSGLWNVSLGHGRRDLAKAGARQMEELGYVSGYVGAQPTYRRFQLAEKLAELAYSSINHFFFAAGGGESVETAFKTARFFWITQGKAREDQNHQPRFRLPRRNDGRHERHGPSHFLANVRWQAARVSSHQITLSVPFCF
jgi:adenosylmethionine-8-amino-7-oxononanoate aminotransferase